VSLFYGNKLILIVFASSVQDEPETSKIYELLYQKITSFYTIINIAYTY